MELCCGGELYERLSQLRRYTERDAADVTHQMLDAINYCHAHSICHRDIKLENWVYANQTPDSPLKLIDWGMSKIYTGDPMTQVHGTVYYVAPEVLAGKYDNRCDVWSIGVILYMLLSGSPPFAGQNDQEIINRIKTAEVTFEGPRWIGISQEAKNFIRYMLTRDPKSRPNASEALGHPWMKKMLEEHHPDSMDSEIDVGVLRNIQKFSRQNAIRRAALGMIAMSLSRMDVANMEEEFRKLDSNREGTIKLDELTRELTTRLNLSEHEAEVIFHRLDQTGDQEIHYTEFLAAALQTKLIMNEKYIKEAFQKFDVNNTGLISEDDLRKVLGNEYKGEDVGQIFRQADYKNNGFIDYEEFVRAIMDTSCREPAILAHEADAKSDITASTYRMLADRLLQLSDESVAVLKDKYGPATFTWGSCRRDARFKMDMASIEKLHEMPIREAISEHDPESERDDTSRDGSI
jgi:calcium-dependent protein kinase